MKIEENKTITDILKSDRLQLELLESIRATLTEYKEKNFWAIECFDLSLEIDELVVKIKERIDYFEKVIEGEKLI